LQIRLQDIIPHPLAEKDLSASDIWKKEIIFQSGEYVHVHAPSGTGKSTFLHILYNLRKDYDGSFFVDEKKIADDASETSLLRKNSFSLVYQEMRLFPDLTGFENLAIKNALTNTADDVAIKMMMQRLGVSHLENKTAKTMSLGEQQRFAIIRSLLQPFQWLLLDEPFSHLDEKNIIKAKELILECCKKNNAGLIIATLGENYEMQFSKNLNL
jgi:putative ABC transport system ATP-binding protein